MAIAKQKEKTKAKTGRNPDGESTKDADKERVIKALFKSNRSLFHLDPTNEEIDLLNDFFARQAKDVEANPRGKVAQWCLKRGRPCKTPYTTPVETTRLSEIFGALDTNKSGYIDMLELLDAMKVVSGGKHVLSARHVDKYLRGMDADGDGLLTLHEFTSYLGTKYLCKPAKDADPQMVQMDEALLSLMSDIQKRDKVAKVLISRFQDGMREFKNATSDRSLRQRINSMFKGRGEMVRGKADSITRAIDPPYPSSKPYQKEKQDSHTVRMKMRAKTFQNPKFQSIYLSDYRPASQESRPATPHLRTVASFRTLTPDGSEKSSWRRRRTSNTGTNNSLVSPRGALAPSGGLTRGGRSPEPGRSPEDVQSLYADLRERAKSVSGLTSSKPSMGISPEELECLGQLANRTRSERANRLQAANTGASPSSGNLQGIRQLTQKPRGSMAVEVPAGEVAPWGSGAEASRPVTAGSARPTVQLRWSLGPLDGSFEEFDQGGCGCSSAANSPDASQQIRTCSDEIQRAQASPQPCSPSRLSTASLGDTSVNPMGPLLLPDLGRLETHIGEVCPSSSSSRSASPPALSSIPAALVDVGLHAGKVLHVPAPPPYSRDYFATDPGERERIRSQAAGLSNVPWSPTGLPKAPLTRRVAHVKPRPPQGMPRPSPGRPGPAAGAKSRRLFAKAGHRASSSPGTKTTEVGVGQMQPPGQQDGDDWEPMIHWESGVPPGLQKERQISGARLRVGSPVRDSGRGVVNPDVPAINKYPFLSVREHLAKQVHGAKSLKELETLGRTAATYSRKRYQSAPASRRSCREELSGTPMEEGSTSRPVSRGSLSPVSRSSSPQVSRHACDQRPASPGIWTIFFKDDEGPDQKRTIRVYPTTKQMTRPSAAMAMSPTRVRSRDHTHPIRSG